MKALYLIDTLGVGGSEQSLLWTIRRFQQTDTVMCHIYPRDDLRADYESADIRVVSLNVNKRYGFVSAVQRALAVIDAERPDIVHTTLFRASMVARVACRLRRIPLIDSFVNDSYSPFRYKHLSRSARMKLRAVQSADARTSELVDCFASNTDAIRYSNCAALGVSPKRVRVIYRGRAPQPYIAGRARRDVTRRALGMAEDAPLILNVARLLQRKGQLELVRAMPAICAAIPSAQLLIAGEGAYRDTLTSEIERLKLRDAITLLGNRNDVPDLLGAADLFAFPSHYEGIGGALIEAMLGSCPIAASNTSVHRELIQHGRTGELFMVERPQAIAESILGLLSRPNHARDLAAAAHAYALTQFDLTRVAAEHEAMYRSVVDARVQSAA